MKSKRSSQGIAASLLLAALLVALTAHPVSGQSSDVTPVNFKIAFIGDQSLGSDAEAVLNLIKSEGAQAVVHSGDFDYDHDPAAWDAQINGILGADFPYFASVGNHDDGEFYGTGGYQEFMAARMNRLGITWDGDLGVKSSFKYNGIFIVLTGPNVLGTDHAIYIKDKLAEDHSIWSISSWHENMEMMQVGGKSDQTGWEVYEESRKGGAIVATAHEHSYSRTYLMSSFQNQTVASTSDTLVLTMDLPETPAEDEGRSFVFVSGLGGNSIRNQELSGDWWAGIYTSDQNANFGALFGVFNLDGVPNMAKFYFKDIDGVVPDSFYVVSDVEDMILPVELASFTAASARDRVMLYWETKSETNNLGFEVQRSSSGESFETIAFVPGKNTFTARSTYTFEDRKLDVGTYRYRLRQIDVDGLFSYSSTVAVTVAAPGDFVLSQNYPNPFNPETEIRFQVPQSANVLVRVFNQLGQEIRVLTAARYEAGYHKVRWDGRDSSGRQVPSGVYIYQLQAGDFTDARTMNLLR